MESIQKAKGAVSEGKLPSTDELVRGLEKAKLDVAEHEAQLPPYGQRLGDDVQRLLDDTEVLLKEKNKNDLVQRLIKHAADAAREAAAEAEHAKREVERTVRGAGGIVAGARVEGRVRDISHSLQNVALGIMRSGELRALLLDVIDIFQTILSCSVDVLRTTAPEVAAVPAKGVETGATEALKMQAKEVAREVAEQAGKCKVLDEGKRRELRQRFDSLWQRAANSPELAQAIDGVFAIFDEFKGRLVVLTDYFKAQAKGSTLPHMRNADLVWIDSYELIVQFTGRKQLDTFLRDVHELLQSLSTDADLTKLIADIRQYIELTLKNPNLLQDEAHQRRSRDLLDRAIDVFGRSKYIDETRYVLHEAGQLLETISEDVTVQRLRHDLQTLTQHIFLDENGRFNFRVTQVLEVLESVRRMVVPVVLEQFSAVPLPRIEGSDETYDYIIDNVTFPGYRMLPEQFDFKAKEQAQFHRRKTGRSYAVAQLKLSVANASAVMRDVHFAFRRKGVISMSDEGLADVHIGGPNATLKVKWAVVTTPHAIQFELRKVFMNLDNFKIDVKEAHHNVLLPMLTTMFNGVIKRRVEKQLAQALWDLLTDVNVKLNQAALTASQASRTLEHKAEVAALRVRTAAERAAEKAAEAVGVKPEEAVRERREPIEPAQPTEEAGPSLLERARTWMQQPGEERESWEEEPEKSEGPFPDLSRRPEYAPRLSHEEIEAKYEIKQIGKMSPEEAAKMPEYRQAPKQPQMPQPPPQLQADTRRLIHEEALPDVPVRGPQASYGYESEKPPTPIPPPTGEGHAKSWEEKGVTGS